MIVRQNPKKLLLKILDIIAYQGNKEKFVDEFLKNCAQQAILDLYNQLPQEKQEQLKKLQQDNSDPQHLIQKIGETIGIQTYHDALQKSTESVFTEYIQEINPTLSNTQKDKLQSYFKTLQISN